MINHKSKRLIYGPITIYRLTSPYLFRTIIGLVLLLFYYLLVLSFFSDPSQNDWLTVLANSTGPILLIVLMVHAIFVTSKRTTAAFWTPYIMFLVNSTVFFGLGPLVYHFGNKVTKETLMVGPLAVNEYQLLETNILNTVGIISVLIGFLFFSKLKFMRNTSRGGTSDSILINKPNVAAVLFLICGFILKYMLILPYSFGLSNYVVPGVLSGLGNLLDLGLALAAYLAAKGSKRWLIILWSILPFHLFVALLEFSKHTLMFAIILPGLGAYLAHHNFRRLGRWILCAAVVFYFVQPFVHYGRAEILKDTGTIYRASLAERLEIFKKYNFKENVYTLISVNTKQGGWTRLCYAGPQSYVIRQYNNGRAGSTMGNAWMAFIPRAIWKNKPVGFGPGGEFRSLVYKGGGGSYLGLTIYGDSYWQFGWLGVIFLCGLTGGLFAVMSKKSLEWMQRRQIIFLPIIFLSLEMSLLGPTGYFINGIIGPIPIFLAYLIAIKFSVSLLKKI